MGTTNKNEDHYQSYYGLQSLSIGFYYLKIICYLNQRLKRRTPKKKIVKKDFMKNPTKIKICNLNGHVWIIVLYKLYMLHDYCF